MLRSPVNFKVLKRFLNEFVGSIGCFKDQRHVVAESSLHYFSDAFLENFFHSAQQAKSVGQFCLVGDVCTKAPERLIPKKFRYCLDVSRFGYARELVGVERCISRACNALANILPWLPNDALEVWAHDRAATQPIDGVARHEGFMSGIVHEDR
jgi:hypothetical protein